MISWISIDLVSIKFYKFVINENWEKVEKHDFKSILITQISFIENFKK